MLDPSPLRRGASTVAQLSEEVNRALSCPPQPWRPTERRLPHRSRHGPVRAGRPVGGRAPACRAVTGVGFSGEVAGQCGHARLGSPQARSGRRAAAQPADRGCFAVSDRVRSAAPRRQSARREHADGRLDIQRTFFTAERPVETARIVIPGDRYSLVYTFRITEDDDPVTE